MRLILIGFFVIGLEAQANDEAKTLLERHSARPDQYSGQNKMHGYLFSEFKNFYNEWNLVTVRYRQDTHEMRFTYANPIAWKALQEGGKLYPKGSMFAKIGFITNEDPAFASSLVPSGAKRYQFMIKDTEKFPDTEGWGYLLFNGKGRTFPGNPIEASKACAACHRIVPDRGFVFSQKMSVEPFVSDIKKNWFNKSVVNSKAVEFEDQNTSAVPEDLRQLLPATTKKLRSIKGDLRKNLFEGTLNEIRPLLAKESLKSSIPAALISEDLNQFTFVYKSEDPTVCKKDETYFKYAMTILSPTLTKTSAGNQEEKVLKLGYFCLPKR